MSNHRPHRSHRLAFRVTPEERRTLARRAAACGLSLSALLRQTTLGTVPRRRPQAIERQAVAQLGRVGNNLNQLARLANTTGRLGSERRLREVLDELQRAIDRLSGR
jgi:hypothetical protein